MKDRETERWWGGTAGNGVGVDHHNFLSIVLNVLYDLWSKKNCRPEMIVLSSVLYFPTMILLLISTKIPSLNDDFMLKSKWQRFLEFPDYRSKLGRWRAQQVVARGGLEQANWSANNDETLHVPNISEESQNMIRKHFSAIVGRIGTGAEVEREVS